MVNRSTVWLTLILSIITLLTYGIPVRADDDSAVRYLHARNLLTSVPGSAIDLSADQNSQPVQSRIYEISGRIVGQVTSDGQPVVIMQSGTVSLEFSAPQAFLDATDWMDTGSIVRVLVKSIVPPNGDTSDGILQLVAAGPETSVSALEAQMSAVEAQLKEKIQSRSGYRQYYSESSRSAELSSRYVASSVPVTGLSDRAAAIYPAYHDTIARLNPRLAESDVATITKSILIYSDEYQLDPRLVIAMIVAESGFDPDCVSKTGATGLGQLMPETAAGLGVTDAFDPQQNIAAAVHILSGHVQTYGGAAPCGVVPLNTLLLTMAAYNAGPGAVKKYGGVPPFKETQNYVRRVNRLYRQLCGS
jgi:soluble lytic murein transglycosylase-like protein